MIRKELVKQLSLPQKQVDDVLSFSYSSLLKAFHQGGKIELSGLGTFVINKRKAATLEAFFTKQVALHTEKGNKEWVEDFTIKLNIVKTILANEPVKEIKKDSVRNLHPPSSEETVPVHPEGGEE